MLDKISLRKQIEKMGGEGSGNFGHEGRPGEVGGSSGEGGSLGSVIKGKVKSIAPREVYKGEAQAVDAKIAAEKEYHTNNPAWSMTAKLTGSQNVYPEQRDKIVAALKASPEQRTAIKMALERELEEGSKLDPKSSAAKIFSSSKTNLNWLRSVIEDTEK